MSLRQGMRQRPRPLLPLLSQDLLAPVEARRFRPPRSGIQDHRKLLLQTLVLLPTRKLAPEIFDVPRFLRQEIKRVYVPLLKSAPRRQPVHFRARKPLELLRLLNQVAVFSLPDKEVSMSVC